MSTPDYTRYEEMKRDWAKNNPMATPEQYSSAMRRIARICGV